jgi:hypothetical protein
MGFEAAEAEKGFFVVRIPSGGREEKASSREDRNVVYEAGRDYLGSQFY